MKPFAPFPHSTSTTSVAATSVAIDLHANVEQVWIDNRGSTDLLIEFFDSPLDTNSYRVPANASQPISTPATGGSWDNKIHVKRPAGSSAENVIIASGAGF